MEVCVMFRIYKLKQFYMCPTSSVSCMWTTDVQGLFKSIFSFHTLHIMLCAMYCQILFERWGDITIMYKRTLLYLLPVLNCTVLPYYWRRF